MRVHAVHLGMRITITRTTPRDGEAISGALAGAWIGILRRSWHYSNGRCLRRTRCAVREEDSSSSLPISQEGRGRALGARRRGSRFRPAFLKHKERAGHVSKIPAARMNPVGDATHTEYLLDRADPQEYTRR